MRLLKRSTSGKLIIEISRNAISAIHLRDGTNSSGRLVTQSAENRLDFADSQALSAKLNSTLQVLNVGQPYRATVCLPRSIACIHVLEMPNISEREMVFAVSLEMEAIFGDDCVNYVWDFVSVPVYRDCPLYAIVFSIPKHTLQSLQSSLEQSNVSVAHITLSELGYGAASSAVSGIVHMVALRENRLDVMICCRGMVVQSQTLTISPDEVCNFNRILGVLRRLQDSLPRSLQDLVPRSMLLLARAEHRREHETPGLFERSLVEQCTSHGFLIDSFTDHELFDFGRRSAPPIDFAHPKQLPAPPLSRRAKATAILAIVVSVAFVLWSVMQWHSMKLSQQVESSRQRVSAIDEKLAALDTQLESATLLTQWEESNVNWNEQIEAISQALSKYKDIYVVRLQMDNQNHLERRPVTRIEGRAKSPQRIVQLTRDISLQNPTLSVQPNGIEPNSIDSEFSSNFRLEIAEASLPTPVAPAATREK